MIKLLELEARKLNVVVYGVTEEINETHCDIKEKIKVTFAKIEVQVDTTTEIQAYSKKQGMQSQNKFR